MENKFSSGFLYGLAGYAISTFVLAGILTFIAGVGGNYSLFNGFLIYLVISAMGMLIIWVPIAIIAGNISKKKGNKSTLMFVLAGIFVSFLVVGGCYGLLFAFGN
jgi:heme/copper-type cytochrome/quinol oxidase subunit 4